MSRKLCFRTIISARYSDSTEELFQSHPLSHSLVMYSLQISVTKQAKCGVFPLQRQERLAIAAIHSCPGCSVSISIFKKFINITESLWGSKTIGWVRWDDDGWMMRGWGYNEGVSAIFIQKQFLDSLLNYLIVILDSKLWPRRCPTR